MIIYNMLLDTTKSWVYQIFFYYDLMSAISGKKIGDFLVNSVQLYVLELRSGIEQGR